MRVPARSRASPLAHARGARPPPAREPNRATLRSYPRRARLPFLGSDHPPRAAGARPLPAGVRPLGIQHQIAFTLPTSPNRLLAVALSQSKRDIASTLNISQRTVAKHLEHCFRKLDVTTQSAAAAKAWALSH